jgi:hypothetical protein
MMHGESIAHYAQAGDHLEPMEQKDRSPNVEQTLDDAVRQRLDLMIELCHALFELVPRMREDVIDRMLEIEAAFFRETNQRLTMPIADLNEHDKDAMHARRQEMEELMSQLGIDNKAFESPGMPVACIRNVPQTHA